MVVLVVLGVWLTAACALAAVLAAMLHELQVPEQDDLFGAAPGPLPRPRAHHDGGVRVG